MKFGTVFILVASSVILLGLCLSEEGANQQENDELTIPVSKEEFEKSDEFEASEQQFEDLEEQPEQSTATNIRSEQIKRRITDAVISRARKLKEELSSSEVKGDQAKEFEEKVLEKMDELSVSDIVEILSEVLSNDEEIKQLIQDIYDSGVSEEQVLEMLKIDGNFIMSRVKEVSQDPIPVKEEKSLQVEYFKRRASRLDTDLLELCPQEPQPNTEEHIGITLSTDDIEYLNGILPTGQLSTRTQLSDAFDWALNGTQYSNYSSVMYRLLFGDKIVSRNFTLALKFANFLSDKGLPSAHNVLGFIYKTGYSIFNESDVNKTLPNPQTALTYYTFSALGSDVMSEMALGYRYQRGLGVVSSCTKALVYYQRVGRKMLKQIGLSGGPALYKIRLSDNGEDSTNGNTMNQDLVEFFQMLAHKGDTSSTNLLGQLFLQGTKGAERNVLTAIKYFEIAAEEKDETALVTLGMIYADCTLKGITDYEKAVSYLEKAIELKSFTARAVLGFLYLVGLGVNQDFQRARQLIEPGVKANNAEAILYFGIMLYHGYGVTRNTDLALRHLIKVSETGNLLAIYYLAKVNADQARDIDPLKPCQSAVKLYKGVAERGYWSHLLMVAHRSYREGEYKRAYLLYSYLAEMGYEVAQSNTAFLLENHRDDIFPQLSDSSFRAFHQWTRSADQGSSLSKIRLGDYSYYGIGRAVDYDRAVDEYREAAKEQNPQAKFNMGFMYERGLGVAKDFPLAKRNYDECLSLEPDSFIAVHLSLFNLLVTSQFDWVSSSVSLPFNINPLSLIISFIINWDIYLITLLVMTLGLVYLMYKQHLAQYT